MPVSIPTLSRFDIARLESLLQRVCADRAELPRYLRLLEDKIASSNERAPHDMPSNVVTMNSKVVLAEVEGVDEFECTLVFPRESISKVHEVSVLTPVGAQLLGAGVGAVLSGASPRAGKRYRLDRIVFQPEAAGRFDL